MRSLPMHSLVSLIANSIFITPSYTDFEEFLNFRQYKGDKILIGSSNEDRALMIESIAKCLYLVGMNDLDIRTILFRLTSQYNKCNLSYLTANSNFYDPSFKFLTNDRVAMIIKNTKAGKKEELDMFKIQMFIYASPWLDMDEYLKYLYYLYE